MEDIKSELCRLISETYTLPVYSENKGGYIWSKRYGNLSSYFHMILAVLYCKYNDLEIIYNEDIESTIQKLIDTTDDDVIEFLTELNEEKCDYQFISELVKYLNCIEEDVFKSVYPEIIEFVFYDVAMRGYYAVSQYILPDSFSEFLYTLMKYYQCHSIYDCSESLASLAIPTICNAIYEGQVYYHDLTIYTKIRLQAWNVDDDCFTELGEKLYFNKNTDVDAFFCTFNNAPGYIKEFLNSEIRFAFVLTTKKDCRNYGYDLLNTHKQLLGNGLRCVVELPDNIFYGNIDEAVLLIIDKLYTEDYIEFINLQDCVISRSYSNRTYGNYTRYSNFNKLDLNKASLLIEELFPQFRVSVERSIIKNSYYILDFDTYANPTYGILNGGSILKFDEVLQLDRGHSVYSTLPSYPFVSDDLFSDNIVDIQLNENKTDAYSGRGSKYYKGKYLMMTYYNGKLRVFVHTSNNYFEIKERNHWAFKLDDKYVNPYYLAMAILDKSRCFKFKPVSKHRPKGLTLDDVKHFSNYYFVVPSLDQQNSELEKNKNIILSRRQAEMDAEKKRLGFKTAASDIAHMLGTTFIHQGSMIDYIRNHTPEDARYNDAVISLIDNVEYTQRMIKYMTEDLDNYNWESNIRELNIVNFITSYIRSWNNFGNKCFLTNIEKYVSDDMIVYAAPDMMAVLMDTLFDNAVRHGFNKKYSDENVVSVCISLVKYNDEPFALLSVRNNGIPIESGFTLEDYISKGRYGENTGRTGLGGNHVYAIAKGNKGFLYLGTNETWNVFVDILIPAKFDDVDNLMEYNYECI